MQTALPWHTRKHFTYNTATPLIHRVNTYSYLPRCICDDVVTMSCATTKNPTFLSILKWKKLKHCWSTILNHCDRPNRTLQPRGKKIGNEVIIKWLNICIKNTLSNSDTIALGIMLTEVKASVFISVINEACVIALKLTVIKFTKYSWYMRVGTSI